MCQPCPATAVRAAAGQADACMAPLLQLSCIWELGDGESANNFQCHLKLHLPWQHLQAATDAASATNAGILRVLADHP